MVGLGAGCRADAAQPELEPDGLRRGAPTGRPVAAGGDWSATNGCRPGCTRWSPGRARRRAAGADRTTWSGWPRRRRAAASVLMLFGDGPGRARPAAHRAGRDHAVARRPAGVPRRRGRPGRGRRRRPRCGRGSRRPGWSRRRCCRSRCCPICTCRPSGFLVSPVLAYWREPGAVGPVDPAETAVVARVPVASWPTRPTGARSGTPAASSARRSGWPTCWCGGSPPAWWTPCSSWAAGRCPGTGTGCSTCPGRPMRRLRRGAAEPGSR